MTRNLPDQLAEPALLGVKVTRGLLVCLVVGEDLKGEGLLCEYETLALEIGGKHTSRWSSLIASLIFWLLDIMLLVVDARRRKVLDCWGMRRERKVGAL